MATSLPKILRRVESDAAPASGSAVGDPIEFQRYLVQCDTYRCLAYLDKDGKWRGAYDNREIVGVKNVISPID